MPPHYPAARFAYDKLVAMQPQNLQFGAPRPARPGAGFTQAVEFEAGHWPRCYLRLVHVRS